MQWYPVVVVRRCKEPEERPVSIVCQDKYVAYGRLKRKLVASSVFLHLQVGEGFLVLRNTLSNQKQLEATSMTGSVADDI